MKKTEWIDAASACSALGVKPATLYAYVSRKLVRATSDAGDARRSLYARADVERLAQQSRRPRARQDVAAAAIRWGDPVLSTAISEVRDGQLWLRGRSVEACAEAMTLEEVAGWLSDCAPFDTPSAQSPFPGATPFSRAMTWLTTQLDGAPLLPAQTPEAAGRLMSGLANACLARDLGGPIHTRLARAWQVDPKGQDLLRRALVLMSDHELNPSTFAVRVAASTAASLPAALMAGLATLSGPRHGGVADQAAAALRGAQKGEFTTAPPDLSPYAFGFGHPLYPEGDPRAAHLLARLPADSPARRAVHALSQQLGLPPNIDMALTALGQHLGAPSDAAATIFTVGRLAGWIAHAAEQAQSGEIIRPRARFGP